MQLANELLLIMVVALVLVVILVALIPRSDRRKDKDVSPSGSVVEFPEKQIKVTLPAQQLAAHILRLPYAPLEETRSDNDEFQPKTALLNLVVARQDDPDLLLTAFDPPLEIEFAYSPDVLRQAKEAGLEYPQYGFWDGCKWVKFTSRKHRLVYEDEPHPTERVAGYARVALTQWNDPLLGRDP